MTNEPVRLAAVASSTARPSAESRRSRAAPRSASPWNRTDSTVSRANVPSDTAAKMSALINS